MNATTFENALMGLHKNLVSYALMLTSQRHEAENLVHETTVKAMTVIDNYPPGSDFKMWVFNVMHDIFVQHYSGRATRVKVRRPYGVGLQGPHGLHRSFDIGES